MGLHPLYSQVIGMGPTEVFLDRDSGDSWLFTHSWGSRHWCPSPNGGGAEELFSREGQGAWRRFSDVRAALVADQVVQEIMWVLIGTVRHICLWAIVPCIVYLWLWEVTLSLGKLAFPALYIFNRLDAPMWLEVFLEDRGMKTFPFQL